MLKQETDTDGLFPSFAGNLFEMGIILLSQLTATLLM